MRDILKDFTMIVVDFKCFNMFYFRNVFELKIRKQTMKKSLIFRERYRKKNLDSTSIVL